DDQRIMGTGDAAEALGVALVSASFWGFFDVRPQLGRFFTAEEDRVPFGTPVAVIGNAYWKSRLGSDSTVIGRQLRIGGKQYTIIGVTPNGFNGIWPTTAMAYVPITSAAQDMFGTADYYQSHNASWLEMIARLKPGATVEAANAELT